MTKDVIPKAEHTIETIQDNLFKNNFIIKRLALRKNAIPAKYHNNFK